MTGERGRPGRKEPLTAPADADVDRAREEGVGAEGFEPPTARV